MDWKTYRHHEPLASEGRYPRNSRDSVFEFLPEQGPGRRFNYVPGKIVAAIEYDDQMQSILEGFRVESSFAGLNYYSGPPRPQEEFIALIERANRTAGGTEIDRRVSPLHALAIQDHGDFGPAGPPRHAPPLPLGPTLNGGTAPGEGVKVGVLDTGAYGDHPLLADHLDEHAENDEIELNAQGELKLGVGHGTFVAGVLRRCAPGATIFPRRVVSSDGVTDDRKLAEVVQALGEEVDILCLPLGGHTMNDRGPLSILTILDRLYASRPDLVVVSAAGNDSRPDPFWPAADDRVIGVGALDENGERAGYSNYGDWVDTYALGTGIHSAFVEWPGHAGDHSTSFAHQDESGHGNQGPWATWSGTSFATPVVAGAIAAAMRPGDGSEKNARDAAFDVVRDGRLPRPMAAGSRTDHKFLI